MERIVARATLRPARARTWAPRGQTPIVRVAGRGGRKLSVAANAAYRQANVADCSTGRSCTVDAANWSGPSYTELPFLQGVGLRDFSRITVDEFGSFAAF